MSYEGYREYVCETGHLLRVDCNEDDQSKCRICSAPFTHWKSVDMTNGYEPDNPSTHSGATEVIGSEEVITERLLHRPVGTLWNTAKED